MSSYNYTKLVSVTKPVVEGLFNSEDLIAYIARASNPSNQLNVATAPRLLKYCVEHKHWSPFEHASMTVEIKTTRAIAAQILRHRSFSFQEFSQRYSKVFSFQIPSLREQAATNRQSSTKQIEDKSLSDYFVKAIDYAHKVYVDLIKRGVAKECARMVLPLCTETTLYMTGNCRSFIHYIELRTQEDTQKEHRDIATEIKSIFVEQFPHVAEALRWDSLNNI